METIFCTQIRTIKASSVKTAEAQVEVKAKQQEKTSVSSEFSPPWLIEEV
jgi:hypothetical protein